MNTTEPAAAGPARRQSEIAEHILRHGSAAASELAERFQVSLMTIHRDLDELARQGVVRKHRGGASAQPSSVFESNVGYRMRAAPAEKAALARHARTLVEPGLAVMLDDSTTALALARLLVDVSPLTVITNFLQIINLLAGAPGIRLLALGGEYHAGHESFLGAPCVEAVEAFRPDLLFASTSAVAGAHAYHQEPEIVQVKRAMLRVARRSVLMVDHTKLGRASLHRLAPLRDFELVLVDRAAPEPALAELREHGIPYQLA